jgi:hypothetical protein
MTNVTPLRIVGGMPTAASYEGWIEQIIAWSKNEKILPADWDEFGLDLEPPQSGLVYLTTLNAVECKTFKLSAIIHESALSVITAIEDAEFNRIKNENPRMDPTLHDVLRHNLQVKIEDETQAKFLMKCNCIMSTLDTFWNMNLRMRTDEWLHPLTIASNYEVYVG